MRTDLLYGIFFTCYLIPRGWKIMPLFGNLHHNPKIFPDPQKFDPTKWQAGVMIAGAADMNILGICE